MYFLLEKDNPVRTLSRGCFLSGFLVMLHSRKFVKKVERRSPGLSLLVP
ncbi:unnamed protein product, partial [Arabidopsis halleri]